MTVKSSVRDTDLSTRSKTLAEWLVYMERIHFRSIDLGLDRVNRVKNKLALTPDFPLIIVGGTNGKGSVCAMLEAILFCAGYRVGCYTSPHLIDYNERIRVCQEAISDDALCAALNTVEFGRISSNTSLTYFEFGTLAAMHVFIKKNVDIAILEVGMGGRLDAVNIFDADCAILTSISLDHMDYLGTTKAAIGFEKSGIFRSGKTAICAEPNAPPVLRQQATSVGANFLQIGVDFGYTAEKTQWTFWSHNKKRCCLPHPALLGSKQLQNATACIMALEGLQESVPVTMDNIREGLLGALLPGRFQVFPGQPRVILDVAHNPGAARVLAKNLDAMEASVTYAVFAMLRDKDISGVVRELKYCVDVWLLSSLDTDRGAQAAWLITVLNNNEITTENSTIHTFPDPVTAYVFACKHAAKNDRICVFGSFLAVRDVLQQKKPSRLAL